MGQNHTKDPFSLREHHRRSNACREACDKANISTEALEAGVIGEMVFALETISSAFNDIDRSERYDVLFDEIKAMQAYVLPKISGN